MTEMLPEKDKLIWFIMESTEQQIANITELGESLKGKWIAVVDDASGEEEVISDFFEALGLVNLKVHGFRSAERFIERASDYDLIVLDGNFGSGAMTGPEAVEKIRANNPGIVIIGRSGEDKYNKEFKDLEVDLILPKDGASLVDKMEGIFELLRDDNDS